MLTVIHKALRKSWRFGISTWIISLLHQEQPHRAPGLARVGISALAARLAQSNVVFPVLSQLHSPISCPLFSSFTRVVAGEARRICRVGMAEEIRAWKNK